MEATSDACAAAVARIVRLLTQNTAHGDVLEFLVTVYFVADVLAEFARVRAAADLGALARLLSEYEEQLRYLLSHGRFARFVTSNRVRKKLELLNSGLHAEASKIFMRLRTERRAVAPRLAGQSASASAGAGAAELARYLRELDPESRRMWEQHFNENPMARWDEFLRAYCAAVAPQPVNEAGLKYLLDNAGTGSVSLYKFSEFLKGFGPLHSSPRNLNDVISADWFHGYLSSDEAERLLHNAAPFTFLVRISKSQLGSFALAYVNEHRRVKHTLVATAKPHGFKIEEQVDNKATQQTFQNVPDVVRSYPRMLVQPFTSTLAREAWFHGDLTAEEATEMLVDKPIGTFLFRFSSHKGCLALTYRDEKGEVQHGKVVVSKVGFRFSEGTEEYLSLQALVDAYKELLIQPLNNTPYPKTKGGGGSTHARPLARSGPSGAPSGHNYNVVPKHPSANDLHSQRGPTPYERLPQNATRLPTQATNSPRAARVPRSPAASPMRYAPNGAVVAGGAAGRGRGRGRGTAVSPTLGARSATAVGEYGHLPTSTSPPPAYGAVPSQGGAQPNGGDYGRMPNSGAAPNGGNYGSVPTDGSSYGSVPTDTSSYGSVPTDQPNAAGSDYGAVPSNDPNYGSIPQDGSNYGSVPTDGGAGKGEYGSVPQTESNGHAGNHQNGYGHLPSS